MTVEAVGDAEGHEIPPAVDGTSVLREMMDAANQQSWKATINAAASEAAAVASKLALLSSAELQEVIREQAAEYEELDEQLGRDEAGSSPTRSLAHALAAYKQSTAHLIKEWDRNRDGQISKTEWRLALRNVLGLKLSNSDLDALFKDFDTDGSGLIDLSEMKTLVHKLKESVRHEGEIRAATVQRMAQIREMVSKIPGRWPFDCCSCCCCFHSP
jgi:hypothetical protein